MTVNVRKKLSGCRHHASIVPRHPASADRCRTPPPARNSPLSCRFANGSSARQAPLHSVIAISAPNIRPNHLFIGVCPLNHAFRNPPKTRLERDPVTAPDARRRVGLSPAPAVPGRCPGMTCPGALQANRAWPQLSV